jgi:SecD/SecF fusion protein
MSETLKWQLFFIVIIVALAGYLAYPSAEKPLFGEGELFEGKGIKPGLDLQGGSEIRVALQKGGIPEGKLKESTDRAKEILELRINAYGLKEPRIQRYGEDQILIQMPGMDETEVNRVKNILTTSGRLEFKLEAPPEIIKDYNERFPQSPPGYMWYEKEVVAGENERGFRVLVKDKEELSGEYISDAGTSFSPSEGVVVTFQLSGKGQKIFADMTAKYAASVVGDDNARRLAIILDKKLVSAPVLKEPIPSGKGQISGSFDEKSAQDLATVLRSGSLPASLEIVSDTYVGPTLGQDSIRRGIISFGLAMIAVALFMVIYYHGAGLIAVIALAMNFVLILGILSFFSATLTLPGIAALILTMGMAVDANILFYERIREERDKGHELKAAFEAGFNRALITVVDANLTTLLAGIILYYFGTGPLKGFAIVLCIGIITTLFTAYFASKVMLQLAIDSGIIKQFSMLRIFHNPKIKFMSMARTFFVLSLLLVVVSVGFFLSKWKDSRGIDFSGGTVLNMKFQTPVDIAYVRDTVQSITATNSSGVTHPKYSDAEIQSVSERLATEKMSQIKFTDIFSQAQSASNEFQVRTRFVTSADGVRELKNDLRTAFAGKITLDPITDVASIQEKDNRYYRLKMTVQMGHPVKLKDIMEKLKAPLDAGSYGEPLITAKPEGTEEASTFDIYFKFDKETELEKIVRSTLELAGGPFPKVENISGVVAKELQKNAVIAIILSWLGMILYLAIRFEFQYGVAAVIALIHDVLISLGSVVIFNLLVPKSWGISLDINLATVASLLTIVGYSVNDTIVVFDRIRENSKMMKGESIRKIIDLSVNQTLSRTLLTSLTVFLTVTVLFIITAQSGGGIAPFAFPMIVGTVVGTYSSIFIASAFLKGATKKETTD